MTDRHLETMLEMANSEGSESRARSAGKCLAHRHSAGDGVHFWVAWTLPEAP